MRYPRRYNVVLAIGFGMTLALASIVGSWAGAGAAYALEAVLFFAALTIGVVVVAGGQHPYPRFGPANIVTTIRAMLAALAAGLVGHPASPAVLWSVVGLIALVAILDGVDGHLARATRMASAFGARFDMETDAAFIFVLAILVWQYGKAGAWVLLCGLMRYAFVAAGRLLPWLAAPLRATRRGRIVAVGQSIGLGVALAPIVPPPASAMVAVVTLAALTWSFAVDVMWLKGVRPPVE
ncbi:MAG: CDP-alcohol phosphatidyltransferase family protein [Acidobacteria bacterium]|nr:CDP-alcohol phosphatidyltransferase family protein [Acidobacteriota bacterium]